MFSIVTLILEIVIIIFSITSYKKDYDKRLTLRQKSDGSDEDVISNSETLVQMNDGSTGAMVSNVYYIFFSIFFILAAYTFLFLKDDYSLAWVLMFFIPFFVPTQFVMLIVGFVSHKIYEKFRKENEVSKKNKRINLLYKILFPTTLVMEIVSIGFFITFIVMCLSN